MDNNLETTNTVTKQFHHPDSFECSSHPLGYMTITDDREPHLLCMYSKITFLPASQSP